MTCSGSWSLIIRGTQLDFAEIGKNIAIAPSRILRKGEVRSAATGPSEFDTWNYEVKFKKEDGLINSLEVLLSELYPCRDFLKALSQSVDVSLRFYVQSDYAQIGIVLPPALLQRMAALNIKFEVSILSWGGIEG